MNEDRELELDELESVSGGVTLLGDDSIIAYCSKCGRKLLDHGAIRTGDGGTTNIFECTNKKCTEYGKKKNNLQVRWP